MRKKRLSKSAALFAALFLVLYFAFDRLGARIFFVQNESLEPEAEFSSETPPREIATPEEVSRGSPGEKCRLVKWMDGDTPLVACKDKKTETIRMLGIDAPETGETENSMRRGRYQAKIWGLSYRQITTCGFKALEKAKELCPEGSKIKVVGEDRDKFERRLAYIYCKGENLNQKILDEGVVGRYPHPRHPEKPRLCP